MSMMKKIWMASGILMLTAPVMWAQVPGDRIWVYRTEISTLDHEFRALAVDSALGLFMVSNFVQDSYMVLIRLDTDAESGGFTFLTETYGYGVAIDSSGKIIEVGEDLDIDNTNIDVAVFDSALGYLWGKTYGDSLDQGAMSVIVDNEGYYVIVGYYEVPGDSGREGFILKLDPQTRDSLWLRTYGGYDTRDHRNAFMDITQDPTDSNYVVIGYSYVNSEGYDDFWILKIDNETGDVIWEKLYGTLQGETGYSICVDGNGNYIASGKKYSPGTEDNLWFMALSPDNGNQLWSREYHLGGNERAYSISCDPMDNHALATGFTKNFSNTNFHGWAMALNTLTGDSVWFRTYQDSTWFYSGAILGDRAYLAGYVYDPIHRKELMSMSVYYRDLIFPYIDSLTTLEDDSTYPYGPYPVQVFAMDNHRIEEVRFFWKFQSDTSFNVSTMMDAGAGWWTDTIPIQSLPQDTSQILYFVQASDPWGNITTSDTLSFRLIPSVTREENPPTFRITPLPNHSLLISLPQDVRTLQIFDVSGRMVFRSSSPQGRLRLRLSPGVYMIRLRKSYEIITKKTVIR